MNKFNNFPGSQVGGKVRFHLEPSFRACAVEYGTTAMHLLTTYARRGPREEDRTRTVQGLYDAQ